MKRGYVYTLDAVFAVIILIITLLILLSQYRYVPEKGPTEQLQSDIMGLLGTVRIGDVCDDSCVCGPGLVTNQVCAMWFVSREMPLFDVVGTLYGTQHHDLIVEWMDELLFDVIPLQYGVQILLDNGTDVKRIYGVER